MTAPTQRILRASDLVYGQCYYSPSGRLCMLLAPSENGLSRTSYLFSYLTRTGKTSQDEGFAISADNARAIAAMRRVDEISPPLRIPRFTAARGLA